MTYNGTKAVRRPAKTVTKNAARDGEAAAWQKRERRQTKSSF